MIDAIFKFVENNPQYWWMALIVVVAFVAKSLIKELPAIIKAIRPLNANIEEMAVAEKVASEEMHKIAQDFGVDRACLSLFHNGTKSLANIHFLKASVIAEGLSDRVGSIMSSLQNRNIAEYGDVCYRLILKREFVRYESIEEMRNTHPGMYVLLNLHLVKSIYMMPIYNHSTLNREGQPLVDGSVFVECCGEEKTIDDQTLLAIQSRAQSVYNEFNAVNNRKGK